MDIPKKLKDISMPRPLHYDGAVNPLQSVNGNVNSKSALEDILGGTRYDCQSNGSCGQRLYRTDDGKMATVWTRGMNETSYTDRGTGYNYFDGTTWQAEPTGRIESVRTGWPTIARWNGNGEIVVAHQNATSPLVINKRTTAGTGPWTESFLPPPSGGTGLMWPSMITSGSNHQYIHIIVLTPPTSYPGGAVYQGLDGALLYFRSADGGATWQKNGIILPQLTATDYLGFAADAYNWANPKGDTIAFVVGDNWTDTFVMESYDNGDTWTKIPILSNANKMIPNATFVEPFYASDGSNAAAIDKLGVIHVAFGRMRASDPGTGKVYYPYTDGLVYWNSTMPMLQDSLNLDTLDAHGQLIGYVVDPGTGDSIHSIPFYGVGMSSYPNITTDQNNSVFVIWDGVTVGNPSPDDMNYRHIWERGFCSDLNMWDDMKDFNDGLIYVYREFAYPFATRGIMNETSMQYSLYYTYQTSDVPGSAVIETTIPVHDNNIEFRQADFMWPCYEGTNDLKKGNISLSNQPNPFRGKTKITFTLPVAGNVVFTVTNVTGQTISSVNKGRMDAGEQSLTFDASSLPAGMYFYSVIVDGVSCTGKMVVE